MSTANVHIEEKYKGAATRPAYNSFAIFLCCFVGLALSALGYLHFTEVDDSRLQERLLRGTQTLAAFSSVNSNTVDLNKVFTTLGTMQQQVQAGQEITLQFLDSFTYPPDAVTKESVYLRYLPKVGLKQNSKIFEMKNTRGETSEFPLAINDSHMEGVRPAGNQGEYYPILLEASTGEDNRVNVIGLNHFQDTQFHVVMDQARDSGSIVSRTSFPLVTATEPNIISHFYIALYTPGPAPLTIQERRARHTGFLSATAFTPAAGFIDFLPQSYLGLEAAFILHTEAFIADNFDPEVQNILNSGKFEMEEFTTGELRTHIIARPSYTLSNANVTSNRWWALSIGLMLTTWVCSLLWINRNRSIKLAQLVDERTHDLTERGHRLSESEARYRMLADNVSDVIFTHDMNGVCTYISPSITQQSGFAVEDYLGKPIHAQMTDVSATKVRNALVNVSELFDASKHPVAERTFESETRCKDGSIKMIESTITLLLDKNGKPLGCLGVSRDITERKKNEEEKAALEAAFHQSQKMEAIGTLAGGVAHDFNNLLTGILGHAELLKSDESPREERSHSVEIIETAALRAKELTSQLLGFARKGYYQSLPVNINQALKESLALLKHTLQKNIKIQVDICEQPLIVTGDPGQISQVFLNLAVNARDAMSNGGTMGFSLAEEVISGNKSTEASPADREQLPPGKYCRITVTDTGVGIPKENIDRIFEPFFTDKPKGKGTGLGLAMVYGVTRNHGGLVTVNSEPGLGTAFTVLLPLALDVEWPLKPVASKQPVTGRGNILVIDDEDIVRELAEMMLHRLGYAVHLAEDGRKGLLYYQTHGDIIDLVIVDMSMPNMGGLECVQHLTRLNPAVKVILATGYSQDSLGDELNRPNFCGFLQKPFLLQDLSELLASCLNS
jgi:PAS domain S-box-containing protein